MFAFKPSRRRIVGVASLTCSFAFAALSFASVPAGAQSVVPAAGTAVCPVLSLGNPNPADDLVPGGYFISGSAFDPTATQGSGISRVDLFLGERDNGGTFLGSAVTGSAAGGDPRAFSIEVTIPNENRGVDFAAYAVSAVSGQQTAVTFPVFVGVPPAKNPAATPTPIPTIETITSTCRSQPAAVAAGAAPAVAAGASPSAVAAATPGTVAAMVPIPGAPASVATTTVCPVLSLGNPNPADDLIPGGYLISGTAFDPSAMTGSGVSRVDLFLGERDNGGTFLGSAVPGSAAGSDPRAFSIEVTIPSENRGLNFAAYAISATNGRQTAVTFPVLVGAPPAKNPAATPTPIPLVETVTSTCSSHT